MENEETPGGPEANEPAPKTDIERIFESLNHRKTHRSSGFNAVVQERETTFGFKIAKPCSLLEFNPRENTFCIYQSASELISSLKGMCYVISISGSPLVGKSTLLNILVSFFVSPDAIHEDKIKSDIEFHQIYTVGNGKNSTTQGIDIFCVTSDETHYIFLDVEGDNDPNRGSTGAWIYTNFIMSAVSVSHIHLYNYNLLLQQNFLEYFGSLDKLIPERKLHPEFQTHLRFIKKNYNYSNDADLIEDYNEMLEYLKDCVDDYTSINVEEPLFIMKNPPDHITFPTRANSCLTEDIICQQCQEDQYIKEAKKIYSAMRQILKFNSPYKNGNEVLETLQKVLELNQKELPFTADLGYLSKLRFEKLRATQERIHQELRDLKLPVSNKELLRTIEKAVSDHPTCADTELLKKFESISNSLLSKSIQMDFIIPELSRFVENLIDPAYTVLNKEEKEVLWKTYVEIFKSTTDYLMDNLKDYLVTFEKFISNIKTIKMEVQRCLYEVTLELKANKKLKKELTISVPVAGLSGLAVTQIGIGIVASFIVGGGLFAVGFLAIGVWKTKKNIDEIKKRNEDVLSKNKVEGVKDLKDAEEAMARTEKIFEELIDNMESKLKVLEEIYKNEGKANYSLIEAIDQALESKIKGKQLDTGETVKLIQLMKVAVTNSNRFNDSI